MIKLKYIIPALKAQGPLKRALRNFFITGHAWGIFSINSHINQHTNNPKVAYPKKKSAQKAAEKMSLKTGKHFSVYRCCFCGNYHVGKNADNK